MTLKTLWKILKDLQKPPKHPNNQLFRGPFPIAINAFDHCIFKVLFFSGWCWLGG